MRNSLTSRKSCDGLYSSHEVAENAAHGTDYRSPAPFKAVVSRRRFLHVGGVLAGAAAVGAGGHYDVIITASTSDGFTRRYAGRVGS